MPGKNFPEINYIVKCVCVILVTYHGKLEGKFDAYASIVCLRHHMKPTVNCKKIYLSRKKNLVASWRPF